MAKNSKSSRPRAYRRGRIHHLLPGSDSRIIKGPSMEGQEASDGDLPFCARGDWRVSRGFSSQNISAAKSHKLGLWNIPQPVLEREDPLAPCPIFMVLPPQPRVRQRANLYQTRGGSHCESPAWAQHISHLNLTLHI